MRLSSFSIRNYQSKKKKKAKELKHTLQDILGVFPISQGFPLDKSSALSKRRTSVGFVCMYHVQNVNFSGSVPILFQKPAEISWKKKIVS